MGFAAIWLAVACVGTVAVPHRPVQRPVHWSISSDLDQLPRKFEASADVAPAAKLRLIRMITLRQRPGHSFHGEAKAIVGKALAAPPIQEPPVLRPGLRRPESDKRVRCLLPSRRP